MPSALRIKELRDLNDNVMMSDGVLSSGVNIDNALSGATFPAGHWTPLGVRYGNTSDNYLLFDNIFTDDYLYYKFYFQLQMSSVGSGNNLYFRFRDVTPNDISISYYYGRHVFDGHGGAYSTALNGGSYGILWGAGLWSVTNMPTINGELYITQVSNPSIGGISRLPGMVRPFAFGTVIGYGTDASTGYGRSDFSIRFNQDSSSNAISSKGIALFSQGTADRFGTNSYIYAWGMNP